MCPLLVHSSVMSLSTISAPLIDGEDEDDDIEPPSQPKRWWENDQERISAETQNSWEGGYKGKDHHKRFVTCHTDDSCMMPG